MVFQEGFRAELPGTGRGVLFGMKILVVPIDLSSVPGVSFPKETSLLRMYLSLIYPVLFSVHFQLDFLYSDYCSDFHLTSVFLHLAVVFLLSYLQPGNSQVEWVDHPTLFQKIPCSL